MDDAGISLKSISYSRLLLWILEHVCDEEFEPYVFKVGTKR